MRDIEDLSFEKKARLKSLEQNVMMRFSLELNQRFRWSGADSIRANFVGTSLGAQDQVFADYLLAANARFALIEFKAAYGDIRTEKNKPLRRALFEELAMRDDMLRRSLDMHFICWGTFDNVEIPETGSDELEEEGRLGRYAAKVAPFMPKAPRLGISDDYACTEFLDEFLESYLVGGSLRRFEVYVYELAQLASGAKGDGSTIEGAVFVYIPGSADSPPIYKSRRFQGIQDLARYFGHDLPTRDYEQRAEPEMYDEHAPKPKRGMSI